jgi:hypothetical protein
VLVSLTVSVGYLAALLQWDDPEPARAFRRELETINEMLEQLELPAIREPTGWEERWNPRAVQNSLPTSGLQDLRRFHAARFTGLEGSPPFRGEDLAIVEDRVEFLSDTLENHLICHSDTDGYYVPVDFEMPLFAPEHMVSGGGIIGSSVRLKQELVWLAPYLDIQLHGDELTNAELERVRHTSRDDPFRMEKIVWLALFEHARVSLDTGCVMVFQ